MDQDLPIRVLPFADFASSTPAADLASLDGLSKDEIRAWALWKSEEYRLLSYTMLSFHNAAAHIHTLPTEVLMKIFGQTWNLEDAPGSLALMSVCRRWRDVYLATPEFWAEAISLLQFEEDVPWLRSGLTRLSNELVSTLLDRSRPCPVTLEILQTKDHDLAPPPFSILTPVVSPYASRIADLTFTGLPLHIYYGLFHMLLGGGLPSLEALTVQISCNYAFDSS